MEGFCGFDTWESVLSWAELGEPTYYQAPLDLHPRRVKLMRWKQFLRVTPLTGRDFDPFFADEDHLGRFLRNDQAPSSEIPPDPSLEKTRVEVRSQ